MENKEIPFFRRLAEVGKKMKILIFVVSGFLAVSILSAEDIKNSAIAETLSAENVEKSTAVTEGRKSFLGDIKDYPMESAENAENKSEEKEKPEITPPPVYPAFGGMKNSPAFSRKAGGGVTTLAELRKIQNMEMVKLKKNQRKEIEALEKNADPKNLFESKKVCVKMKARHRKEIRELKNNHKEEIKEFKKAHPQ
ncbi:MAG: hypothetical protein L6420_04630 [Elusimicrobia bacterium]|nr:hypothetical protein [Elusimicrobiota bacterium]